MRTFVMGSEFREQKSEVRSRKSGVGRFISCFLLPATCFLFITLNYLYAQGSSAGTVITNGGDSGTAMSADSAGDTFITGNFIGSYVVANSTAIVVSTGYAISSLSDLDNQTASIPGTTVYFNYSVRNGGNASDRFSLSVATISGQSWTAYILRTDSATQISQTDLFSSEATFYFLVAVSIPAGVPHLSSTSVRLTVKNNFGSGTDDNWPQGESQNDTLSDDLLAILVIGPPSSPVLSGVAASTTQILWNWTYSGNPLDGFRLYSTSGGVIANNLSATVTTYLQSGLLPATSYSAYLQAFNSSGTANSNAISTNTHALPVVVSSTLTLTLVNSMPQATSSTTLSLLYQITGGSPPYTASLIHIGKSTETVSLSNSGIYSMTLNLDFGENEIVIMVKDNNTSTVTVSVSTSVFRAIEMKASGDGTQAKADLTEGPAFVLRLPDADTKPMTVEINNGMKLGIPEGCFEKGTMLQIKVGVDANKSGVLKKAPSTISMISGNELNMIQINAKANGVKVQPLRPINFVIPYRDPTPLDPNDDFGFKIAYFDESTGKWKVTGKGTTVDPVNDTITAAVDHFTLFATVNARAPAADFSDFIVYPNPFRPNSGDGRQGQEYSMANQESGIIFDRLTENAKVQIFSLAGEKVKEMKAPDATSRIRWDAKNEQGETVVSGIYFYLVTDAQGRKLTGKLAIVR